MARIAKCPHCHLVYKLSDKAPEGHEVVCESCGQKFALRTRPMRASAGPDTSIDFDRWKRMLLEYWRVPATVVGVIGVLLLLLMTINFIDGLAPQPPIAPHRNFRVHHQPVNRTPRPPDKAPPAANQTSPERAHPGHDGTFRVVVDTSFGGQSWEGESTDASEAEFVRQLSSRGWTVDLVPADYHPSPSGVAPICDQMLQADLLMRVVGSGRRRNPPPQLIAAYQDAVRNGSVLLLWGLNPADDLATSFGLRFNWRARGFPLDSLWDSPMTTHFDQLEGDWTGVTRMPIEAVELAWVRPPTHTAMPVLGFLPYGEGLVIFCGADKQLTKPMQEYLMSLCTAVETSGADRLKKSQRRIRQLRPPPQPQRTAPPVVPGSGMGSGNQRPEREPGPELLSPTGGTVMPQLVHHKWVFDWSNLKSAAEYHVLIFAPPEEPGGKVEVIRRTVEASQLTIEPGTLGISSRSRTNWTWKVRGIGSDGSRTNWSRTLRFDIGEDSDVETPRPANGEGPQ